MQDRWEFSDPIKGEYWQRWLRSHPKVATICIGTTTAKRLICNRPHRSSWWLWCNVAVLLCCYYTK